MKKVIAYKSSRDHYIAEACILWCFDDRFTSALNEFTKNFKNYDLVKVAGGAKALTGKGKEFILNQIKISINLHHTKKIILMTHSDCGACGGLKAFDNNCEKEMEFQKNELEKAKEYLKENLPDGIEVKAIFVDFEKIYSCG